MSNKITISHELGTIEVTPNTPLNKTKKCIIKGLSFLQLICMTPDSEEDENFNEFVDIISEAANKVQKLYNGDECNESASSISQF